MRRLLGSNAVLVKTFGPAAFLVLLVTAGVLTIAHDAATRPRPNARQRARLGTYSIGRIEIPLAAIGGDGTNYTWALVPGFGSLPPGVSLRTDRPSWFEPNQQAGLIGVATVPARYSFRLQVTSDGQSAFQDYTLTISSLVVNDLDQLPDATAGEPYSYTLSAFRDGASVPARWTPISGFTPGITLTPDGVLSGTPRAADAGSHHLWFSVAEGGETVFRGARIDVYAADITTPGTLPDTTAVSYGRSPVSLESEGPMGAASSDQHVFDDCTFGVSCGRGVAVRSGGSGPFTWTAAGLPRGMSIRAAGGITARQISPGDAEIWGTPIEMGAFNVTVTATAPDGATATNTFTLRVSALLLADSLKNGTVHVPFEDQPLRVLGGIGPYAATLVGGRLPLDVALDPTTLTVSGAPREDGRFNVTFHVADADPVNPKTLDASTSFFVNSGDEPGTVIPGSSDSQRLRTARIRPNAQTLTTRSMPVAVAMASPNPAEATGPGGAIVALHGTQSSDPRGRPLTLWWQDGSTPLGTGGTLSVPWRLARTRSH